MECQWIQDPVPLTQAQREADLFSASGYASGLVPDSGGQHLPFLPGNHSFPKPHQYFGKLSLLCEYSTSRLQTPVEIQQLFDQIPNGVGTYAYVMPEAGGNILACYVTYTNVTYEAGAAATCTHCKLSSYATVETTYCAHSATRPDDDRGAGIST